VSFHEKNGLDASLKKVPIGQKAQLREEGNKLAPDVETFQKVNKKIPNQVVEVGRT